MSSPERPPTPKPFFYEVKTVLGTIKSSFDRVAQHLRQIQRNCGPDPIMRVPGSEDQKVGFKTLRY